jgi:hypothetical protein
MKRAPYDLSRREGRWRGYRGADRLPPQHAKLARFTSGNDPYGNNLMALPLCSAYVLCAAIAFKCLAPTT